jgi:SAM-dependent methyltransferase
MAADSVWERVLRASDLLWPDENVVRCVNRFFGRVPREERAALSALDIGFGSGRHVLYLAQEGFRVYGLDIAQTAIARILDKVARYNLNVDIRQEELLQTTMPTQAFALVVGWGSLFCADSEGVRANLHKVHDLLLPSGILCANFRTTRNWFYGLGESLGKHTFRLDARSRDYEGIVYHFFEEDELVALLQEAGLEVIYNEYVEWRKFGTETHSWWIITARKPA